MSRFLAALRTGRVLLMDGAMGTELRRAGLANDACPELCNLTHADRVKAIHQAYRDAGAVCLVTNTFQAHPQALAKYGLQDQLDAIQQAALTLARSAGGPASFALASLGPIGEPLSLEAASQLARSLPPADALLLETWSNLKNLEPLLQAIQSTPGIRNMPVLLSLTYHRTSSGKLKVHQGEPPDCYARVLGSRGVAALGVNCGRDIDMDEIISIVRCYRQETDLPVFARPNAGTPLRSGDQWLYPQTPATMAARLPELLEAGVRLVGGCCGTTPEHIAAFRPIIAAWNEKHRIAENEG